MKAKRNDDGSAELIMIMLAVAGVTVGLLAILACAAKALVR